MQRQGEREKNKRRGRRIKETKKQKMLNHRKVLLRDRKSSFVLSSDKNIFQNKKLAKSFDFLKVGRGEAAF